MAGKLILVVDDESYITTVLTQKLQRCGHQVIACSNGHKALLAIAERRPDLIISDYQMPLVTGLEMAAQLRQDTSTRTIPVIMLTSRGHRVTDAELAHTNIVHLLAKPFSMKEVVSKVEQVIATLLSADGGPPVREAA